MKGLEGLQAHIAAMMSRAVDVAPAADVVHEAWLVDRKADFASGGASTMHGVWPANSLATVKRKGHTMPLIGNPVNGNNLRASVIDPGHRDHVFVVSADGMQMGTNNPTAAYNSSGANGRPIRRAVDPTEAQRRTYVSLVASYVMDANGGQP